MRNVKERIKHEQQYKENVTHTLFSKEIKDINRYYNSKRKSAASENH